MTSVKSVSFTLMSVLVTLSSVAAESAWAGRLSDVVEPSVNAPTASFGTTLEQDDRLDLDLTVNPESLEALELGDGALMDGSAAQKTGITATMTWSYGGEFQVDDCNRNNVNNPKTGTLACPSGFTAYKSGRSFGPESKCGSNQFVCLKSTYSSSTSYGYGGMFQIDDCGRNNVGNPNYYGWMACPTGYSALKVARVMAPESGCGAWQYACVTSGMNSGTWQYFGGTFQIDDCATNSLANFYTKGLYCPAGYTASVYGRVKGPESKCGVTQYSCTLTP